MRLPMYRSCTHYRPRGLTGTCAAGVDIRTHVGGDDFGWAIRRPCIRGLRSRDVVPCELYDDSDQEERDRASLEATKKILSAWERGVCAECEGTLERAPGIARCASGCDFWVRECRPREHEQ